MNWQRGAEVAQMQPDARQPQSEVSQKHHWGLQQRLTIWFLIVSVASVALTTLMTTFAVYQAQLRLARQFPEFVLRPPTFWGEEPTWFITDPRSTAANEAFRDVSRTAIIAGFGAFLLSGLAAAIVTRRLTKPLQALEDAANRLERGERNVKLTLPEQRDELRTVTESFNRLVESLERQETWRQQLVADIAHDLRNPLGVMRAELEAMQDGVRPRDDENLERLLHEVSLLSRLVGDLRTLSSAETGALHLQKRETLVRPWLENVVESLEGKAHELGIHLSLLQAPDTQATFDPTQLERVMRNIIENALEHSFASRVTIDARLESTQLVIVIADNGRGLPHPERVFERFYRGDQARVRGDAPHSGLGLAIAKAIVEAHGGTLEARNDGGAVFVLRMSFSE
jgi:two-component system, OmpR family, sensor histidine kinase BaeS